MGEVYKARDTRLDRTVAIKVLPEHVAADPDLKQRFEREAKTISSLNHPPICTLYNIGCQDGIDLQRLEKGLSFGGIWDGASAMNVHVHPWSIPGRRLSPARRPCDTTSPLRHSPAGRLGLCGT